MEYIKIKRSNLYNFFVAVLIFFVILSSASILVLEDVNIIHARPLKISIWFLTLLLIISKITRFPKKKFIYLFLIVICFLGYSFFRFHYVKGALSSIYIPLILFYFLACINEKEIDSAICRTFVNVMCFLSAVSLFFYIAASVVKLIQPTGYLSYHWSWIKLVPSYFNLYFEPLPASQNNNNLIFGKLLPKNSGIFPEAPMYNFPLCVALGINILLIKSDKKLKNILLTLSIITCGATTGYIFLAVLYGYIIIRKYGLKSILGKLFLSSIILIIVVYVILNVLDRKAETGSYSVRYDHVIACLQTILDTHFLGAGIGNSSILESNMEYKQGASVGFLYLFAQGGLFNTLLLLIPMINSLKLSIRYHDIDMLMFTLLFFLLVFLTQVVFRNNMWFIVAAVFMNIDSIYNARKLSST